MVNSQLESAVRGAVETYLAQPSALPETPDGWVGKARAALDSGNEIELTIVGLELRSAHSQYRADCDCRASLFDIRVALQDPIREYVRQGYSVQHLVKH